MIAIKQMNKITSLEDYKNQKKEVRGLGNGYSPDVSDKNQLIGGIFKVRAEYYYDNTISVYDEYKTANGLFNKSDVQFLTPISYKGYRVGVGDMVKAYGGWHEVFAYVWHSDRWALRAAINKNYNKCLYVEEDDIEDIKPLYKPSDEIEVNIVGEDKTVKISRKSAIAINLIEE